MVFRLYTGNRLELLAGALAETLSNPLPSPFEKDIIIVQSKGMERWISMQLAKKQLICANISFPYPKAFLNEIFSRVLSDTGNDSGFDPEVLTWKIMDLLPGCLNDSDFNILRNYLGDGTNELKLYQLSSKVADAFDQYLLFRPDMIFKWEKGEESHWQAKLWRMIVKNTGKNHRAALGKTLLETLKSARKIPGLPARAAVFGISSLPPFFLEVLSALSKFMEINLFLMNPCMEFWGDIQSKREIRKATKKMKKAGMDPGLFNFEQGNSLLASMGTMGRDWFDIISGFGLEENSSFEEAELFQDALPHTLLGYIQSDILRLEERKQGGPIYTNIPSEDNSVTIHSCHSPMREVEVLHDNLLSYFEQDPALNPADILVMAPDIELYAPYIEAVFNKPDINSPERIPFSIADRSIRKESTITDTFLNILDLRLSRFGASKVLEILKDSAVLNRFGLQEPDTDMIVKWVDESGIRWALDGKNKIEMGLPATEENTWRSGLKSLLLGYAMPGYGERLYSDILPYDNIEGEEAAVLGRFVDFAEKLFASVRLLNESLTLDEWADKLREMLDRFFLPDNENEAELQHIRAALNGIKETAAASGYEKTIDISVIRTLLSGCLEKESFGTGFITGAVTFCSMLPMRSIPFRVICLLGMNNDAYPRQSRPPGFDLISKNPRKGDRSRRNDDRYLFLETILSARDRLYISYIGQDIRDNSIKPPSVLVSELTDYILQGFGFEDENRKITVRHRLQAFSPGYFNSSGTLFSYSKENLGAALCLTEPRQPGRIFIEDELEKPEDDWLMTDVADIVAFYSNPAKYLLNYRLRIFLESPSSILQEKEIFSLSTLDKYSFEQSLLEKRIEGRDLLHIYPVFKASGRLPHGVIGQCVYSSLSRGIESFASRTLAVTKGEKSSAAEIKLEIPPFSLSGNVNRVYPEGLIHYRYARRKPKDLIRLWINHLALCAMGSAMKPSHLICLNDKNYWEMHSFGLLSTAESIKILKQLLDIYYRGLCKPLPFFPSSSFEFFEQVNIKNKTSEEALQAAQRKWEGNDFAAGECTDPYFSLCFKNTDPFNEEFCETALKFYSSLADCMEDGNA